MFDKRLGLDYPQKSSDLERKMKAIGEKFAEILWWIFISRQVRFKSLDELPSRSIIPPEWVGGRRYGAIIEQMVCSREFHGKILDLMVSDMEFLNGAHEYISSHQVSASAK